MRKLRLRKANNFLKVTELGINPGQYGSKLCAYKLNEYFVYKNNY